MIIDLEFFMLSKIKKQQKLGEIGKELKRAEKKATSAVKVAEDSMDKIADVKEKYSKEKRMMETEVKGVTKKLQTAGVHHKSLIAANAQLEEKERVIEQQEQEIVELKQSLDYLESLMGNERLNHFDKYTMSYTPETDVYSWSP